MLFRGRGSKRVCFPSVLGPPMFCFVSWLELHPRKKAYRRAAAEECMQIIKVFSDMQNQPAQAAAASAAAVTMLALPCTAPTTAPAQSTTAPATLQWLDGGTSYAADGGTYSNAEGNDAADGPTYSDAESVD